MAKESHDNIESDGLLESAVNFGREGYQSYVIIARKITETDKGITEDFAMASNAPDEVQVYLMEKLKLHLLAKDDDIEEM